MAYCGECLRRRVVVPRTELTRGANITQKACYRNTKIDMDFSHLSMSVPDIQETSQAAGLLKSIVEDVRKKARWLIHVGFL